MSTLRYSRDHQWISLDDAGVATVGITDYAQQQLGDIVYVDLPIIGTTVEQHGDVCVVESVKSAGEVKAPVSGEIIDVNASLMDEPQKVNADPLGEGWFLRLKPSNVAELDALLDEPAYNEFVSGLA
jgi:glycine cleavage system H protein